jgi:uncharacterized lipoprotein
VKWLAAIAVLTLAGCEVVDRPRRQIAPHFEAQLLTGEKIDREFFKGSPWVINVWVPG